MKKFKGTKDLLPEAFSKQKEIFEKVRSVIENFNYKEYSTPLVEYKELYLKKTSSELIDKQSFKIEDKELIIRPEITPSLIRMLGKETFSLPLRLYSIQNMMRNENPQKNRLREFYQINIDMFYNNKKLAIIEQMELIKKIFKKLNIKETKTLINNKKWVIEINKNFNWTDIDSLFKILDKGLKQNIEDEIKNFNNISSFKEFLKISSWIDFNSFIKKYKIELEDLEIIKELEQYSDFSPYIVRGLDYYTGYVFEVFSEDSNRAMLGGGEYELGTAINNKELYAIGMGIGETSLNSLYTEIKDKETVEYLITYQDDKCESYAQKVFFELTANNNCLFIDKKIKISKAFKYTEKYDVENIVFINLEELKNKQVLIKCQKTRQSKLLGFNELNKV